MRLEINPALKPEMSLESSRSSIELPESRTIDSTARATLSQVVTLDANRKGLAVG